ncbi:hypothetical protein J6590_086556 [Homalodisca vitripennis]|nr:hypothetical protein J6590_086556 [Homalodisca vitripennis]
MNVHILQSSTSFVCRHPAPPFPTTITNRTLTYRLHSDFILINIHEHLSIVSHTSGLNRAYNNPKFTDAYAYRLPPFRHTTKALILSSCLIPKYRSYQYFLKAHTAGTRYFSNTLSRSYRSYLSPSHYVCIDLSLHAFTHISNGSLQLSPPFRVTSACSPQPHTTKAPILSSCLTPEYRSYPDFCIGLPVSTLSSTGDSYDSRCQDSTHSDCLPKHPNHYVYLRLSLSIPSV